MQAILEELAPTERFEPTDWQVEDLEYLTSRDCSANWSEMGCFKTSTGLWLIAQKLAEIKKPKVLIVTTKAGKGTYFDAIPKIEELHNELLFNVHAATITERLFNFELDLDLGTFLDKLHSQGGIVLSHYHCYTNRSKLLPLLHELDWDFVLLDEAHRIKNRKAQWTRNIKKLKVDQKHLMTGTGFINDPAEVWSLLNFLDPKRFTTYHGFRRKYCDEVLVGGFPKVIGIKPSRVEEFRALRKEVGVRREMADVHSQIDHPIFSSYEVDLNPTQRRMYDGIKRELFALDQQGAGISSPNVLSQLNRLRQICVATPEVVREYYDPKEERRVQEIRLIEPSSKLDTLMEIIDGLSWDAESKQPIVVFSNFRDPLTLLKTRLDKVGTSYLHMEQKHNDQTRYEMWHDVFPKKEHQVFMSTLQLGGESINLTPASYCVFLDRSWSPAQNNQGVGRVYRPGQTGGVEVIHVNARSTTDQRIEKTVNEKTGWFKQIFGKDSV